MHQPQNRLQNLIKTQLTNNFSVPPVMKPSDWAETYFNVIDGPKAGERITLYNFQKEMLNVLTDPNVDEVVYKMSAQVGKTTLMTVGLLYFLMTDPSNIAFGAPTDQINYRYKTSKLDPLIESTPEFSAKFASHSDPTKKNNSKILQLKTGQSLTFISMGSEAQLRGVTARRIFADEVVMAERTEDGDPRTLLRARAGSFPMGTYKIIWSSTPTVPFNPIDEEYDKSDQRKWFITHKCGHVFTPTWDNVAFDWTKPKLGERKLPMPETARYVCKHCGEVITEIEWKRMIKAGKWIATNPESNRKAGFYASRLMNTDLQLYKHVDEFRNGYISFDLQSFYNNVLGVSWTNGGSVDDVEALEKLRNPDIKLDDIPAYVQFLTAGIDVQKDRVEVTILGVTTNSNIVVLKHFALPAEVETYKANDPVWNRLRDIVNSQFMRTDGINLPIRIKFVDSSDGKSTNVVYRFCEANERHGFMPIKGSSVFDAPLVPTGKTDHQNNYKTRNLVMLGVSQGKMRIQEILKAALENDGKSEPTIQFSNDLPPDYMAQITSERLMTATGKKPKWVLKTQAVRNESLDTLNYAYLASVYMQQVKKFPVKYFIDENEAKIRKLQAQIIERSEPTETNTSIDYDVNHSAPRSNNAPKPQPRRSIIRKR